MVSTHLHSTFIFLYVSPPRNHMCCTQENQQGERMFDARAASARQQARASHFIAPHVPGSMDGRGEQVCGVLHRTTAIVRESSGVQATVEWFCAIRTATRIMGKPSDTLPPACQFPSRTCVTCQTIVRRPSNYRRRRPPRRS